MNIALRKNVLLIRNIRKYGGTYKKIQDIVVCPLTMVANALKFES